MHGFIYQESAYVKMSMGNVSSENYPALKKEWDAIAKKIRSLEAWQRKLAEDINLSEKDRLLHRKTADELLCIMVEEMGIAPTCELKNFYFTFGDSPEHPYHRGQYLIVREQDENASIRRFREKYPHPEDPERVCCASCWTEEYFLSNLKGKSYKGEPREIIEG